MIAGSVRRGAVVTAVTALVLGVLGAPVASATVPRPADGTLTVVGHGWGHGIGMSQYGALGGAQNGAGAGSIVAFYYSGTTLGAIGNPPIRVAVASLGPTIGVKAMAGLAVTWDGETRTPLPSVVGGAAVTGWRLAPDPSAGSHRVRLERLTSAGSTWTLHALSPGASAGVVNLNTAAIETSRSGQAVVYRGELRAVRTAAGAALTPVVVLPMESYLRSVVPSEMPASWPAAAVQAQSIAARSYAEHLRRSSPVSPPWFDVWDDTRSQVFRGSSVGGVRVEQSGSDAAVAATAGQAVIDAQGEVAFTQFSSSSGGWTVAGSRSYLAAKADPWDAVAANPNHSWESSVPVSRLEAAYPAIGTLRSLSVTGRDGHGDLGGRVISATLVGSAGSVAVTGESLRSAMALRSTWFDVVPDGSRPSYPRDVTGDGRADVVAIVAGTGALRVYPRGTASSWYPPVVSESGGWESVRLAATAGTMDDDAISDLVLVDGAGEAMLRRGRGAGLFESPVPLASGWQVYDAIIPVGDFDGDGWTDLLTRRSSDGALMLHRGDGIGGLLGVRQVGSGWSIFTAVLSPGDFTGDGIPDVLGRTASGELWLYPGNGTGGWRPRSRVGTGWQVFTALTAVGDIDLDGRGGDVLARLPNGELWLYPASGTGGWRARSRVGTGWQMFSAILR